MITLPQTKRWTGDGFGDTDARIFTLVQRNEKVALFKRTVEKTGRSDGYEVFVVKMRLKGQALPGGLFEQEDREVYPSAGSFGKTAWHIHNLPFAKQRFEDLTLKGAVEAEEENAPAKTYLIPAGDFTTKEFAAANNVEYSEATIWLRENTGTLVLITGERKPPAGTRGKASKTFAKAGKD